MHNVTIMGLLDFLPSKKGQIQKQQNIVSAEEFVKKLSAKKAFDPIATNILLDKGEKAFMENNNVILMETKAIRYSSRSGVGVRVAKGIYVGGGSGKSESHDEMRPLDNGTLTLTSKRLIFDGKQQNRVVLLSKILSVQPWFDAIEVSTSSQKKSMMYSVNNPYMWSAAIAIIRNVDDPEDIGDTELKISFR